MRFVSKLALATGAAALLAATTYEASANPAETPLLPEGSHHLLKAFTGTTSASVAVRAIVIEQPDGSDIIHYVEDRDQQVFERRGYRRAQFIPVYGKWSY